MHPTGDCAVDASVPPLSFGVMQGRLSPPIGNRTQAFPWATWQREFQLARSAGVQLIEWIVDADRFDENPLLTRAGRAEVRRLEEDTGTLVRTVCADCFVSWPLSVPDGTRRRERLDALGRILEAAAEFGVTAVTLPFVDESDIRDDERRQEAVATLREALRLADVLGVTLALETALSPDAFRALLHALDHPRARVNYDSGNSASLGYDVAEEFAAYGSYVATVHIKDRLRGGTTVPLGTGHADFPRLVASLRAVRYTGPLILQAARRGEEVQTVREYVAFMQRHLEAADISPLRG